MPLVERSDYVAPRLFRGKHSATILPSLFRPVADIAYQRERIELPDGDFLDLDWAREDGARSKRLLILSHGLEGDSRGKYILGMARAFRAQGWDALAWNFRGCSGEDNRLLRTYHGGASDDLDHVVRHALREKQYQAIVLTGFSMGGNITLKYLGEQSGKINRRIRGSVVFSVPCHFADCSQTLARKSNRVYMWKFLSTLRAKVRTKKARFPDQVDDRDLHRIKDFLGFDERFTAPTNGFRDAMDYWTSVSSLQFIERIRVPTLLVNAKNDPFLAPACFPFEQAQRSPYFHFEAPDHGGHVGFARFDRDGLYWSEKRALEFVQKILNAPDDVKRPAAEKQRTVARAKKKATRATATPRKKPARKAKPAS